MRIYIVFEQELKPRGTVIALKAFTDYKDAMDYRNIALEDDERGVYNYLIDSAELEISENLTLRLL